MNLRIILTGTSGMVGEGVLLECLANPAVEVVLSISRKPCGHQHPKLKEIIHADFYNLQSIASQLSGYNACFFCLGISSVGISKEDYYKTTYTLTMQVAEVLLQQNKNITFCYISGAGTDSTEKGWLSWARVKGKTENDLIKLPFKAVYAFRPGFLKATPGQKNLKSWYTFFEWLYPVTKAVAPNIGSTLQQLGQAMIRVSTSGYPQKVLEVKDIIQAAKP